MAKYVIELPDDMSELFVCDNTLRMPAIVGFNRRIWIDTCIGITPYTEPDEQEIREKVEQEVWEFAKKIRLKEFFDDNHNLHPYLDYFDSYQDAKAKHEALKKQKDEIHVGDELINHIGKTYVIYDIDDHTAYGINLDKHPCTQECFPVRDGYFPKRTGRHFPEIAELLKKMRED